MSKWRKYPVGLQSFEDIITGQFTYVDKTDLIYRLVKTGKVYFLSRPRRFGKTLLISTLEAYFEGRKELFKGLAIDKLETEWTEYPVLHIDFGKENFCSEEYLNLTINAMLCKWEKIYGTNEWEKTFALRLDGIIQRAYEKTGKKVVVLVDEYDKPLIEAIGNVELTEKFRGILRGFYSVLKSADKYLKFVFLTGITKYGHVNIFSGLNQLKDISLYTQFDTLCGISEDELLQNFGEDIKQLAKSLKLSREETLVKLKKKYDGYHFSQSLRDIYNPFSLLSVFDGKLLTDYWFQTATPTFLVKFLQETRYSIVDLDGVQVSANKLCNYRPDDVDPTPLFYQTGYLTIKAYDAENDVYTLGFPNDEVYKGFINCLNEFYFPSIPSQISEVRKFWKDLQRNDVEAFMKRFQAFITSIDYSLFRADAHEKDYQFIFVVMFMLLGLDTRPEVHTSNGRMDAVIYTQSHIYIFEFKLDKTAAEALAQIDEKHYADRFLTDGRKIVKIGANFSSAGRTLESWEVADN